MKNKGFIYGLMFGFVLIPMLDELTNLIVSLFELHKATINKKILKENKLIADLQAEQETVSTQCIGFQYNTEDEYEDNNFEDKKKSKLGFHI